MRRVKKSRQARLRSILDRLARKFRPDEVQKELADIYVLYADLSKHEAEREYWFKCSRASYNLSSGMDKWLSEVDED